MKNILIIIALLIIFFNVSCQSSLIVDTVGTTNIPETVIVTETVIVEDTAKINELENQLADSQKETEKYQELIGNLNGLLKNVYYVYGEGNGTFVYGTGFSLEYNDRYYLITAGHIVDGEWGIHKNLGFRINNKWIYPKLLAYKVTDTIPDYAIFYSDKIKDGLNYDLINTEPDYRLGIDIVIQENNNWGEVGSCGSPVIDLDGEVIGLHVGYLQDIDEILQAIN